MRRSQPGGHESSQLGEVLAWLEAVYECSALNTQYASSFSPRVIKYQTCKQVIVVPPQQRMCNVDSNLCLEVSLNTALH